MRNLAEPGSRFRAGTPNHPETLLGELQASQAVGEKSTGSTPNINRLFVSNCLGSTLVQFFNMKMFYYEKIFLNKHIF